MEPFNSRYAEMSSLLVENSDLDPDVPEAADLLAFYWTSHNDARNYAVVGDPAVRVCAVEGLTKAKIDLAQQQPEPVTVAQEIAQAGHDSFSWGEAKEAVSDAVAELRDKLGDMLDRTLTGLTTLQVVSRTSDDSRRAETKVDLTGRTESVIPLKDGAIDETLWKLHQEMVDKAMAHRAAMWQVAANVAGQAVGWLGKK
jgi:hypothetical protein